MGLHTKKRVRKRGDKINDKKEKDLQVAYFQNKKSLNNVILEVK